MVGGCETVNGWLRDKSGELYSCKRLTREENGGKGEENQNESVLIKKPQRKVVKWIRGKKK